MWHLLFVFHNDGVGFDLFLKFATKPFRIISIFLTKSYFDVWRNCFDSGWS